MSNEINENVRVEEVVEVQDEPIPVAGCSGDDIGQGGDVSRDVALLTLPMRRLSLYDPRSDFESERAYLRSIKSRQLKIGRRSQIIEEYRSMQAIAMGKRPLSNPTAELLAICYSRRLHNSQTHQSTSDAETHNSLGHGIKREAEDIPSNFGRYNPWHPKQKNNQKRRKFEDFNNNDLP